MVSGKQPATQFQTKGSLEVYIYDPTAVWLHSILAPELSTEHPPPKP